MPGLMVSGGSSNSIIELYQNYIFNETSISINDTIPKNKKYKSIIIVGSAYNAKMSTIHNPSLSSGNVSRRDNVDTNTTVAVVFCITDFKLPLTWSMTSDTWTWQYRIMVYGIT